MNSSLLPISNTPAVTRAAQPTLQDSENNIQRDFSDILKTALDHVSQTEKASNDKTQLFAAGKIDNLHDVMITAQKASITVETAVQIQQKVLDAYNEVMRMQI